MKQTGSVFNQFKEGEINFAPTYKFDKQSDEYDSGPKKRVPSWCDRILYASTDCEVTQLTYESKYSQVSDH